MVAVIDYGVGNLFSLLSSLKAIGADAVNTSDIETIRNADRIILPGVGAFEDAAKKLFESGLHEVLIDEAKKMPVSLSVIFKVAHLCIKVKKKNNTKNSSGITKSLKPSLLA